MTTTTPGTTVDTGSDAGSEPIARGFWEQGFVHVPGLLTEDEVIRFRTAALDAVRERSKEDKDFGTGIVSTTDAWETDPVLRELALHPRIGALAEQVAGMPLRVWAGEVLVKSPHESATTDLHDDLTFALLDSRLMFNVWIALVDVPVERGCLTFLPRSHRREGPERVALSEQLADPDGYLFAQWPELRWSPRVTAPLRAGDATVHHNRTAHSAGANTLRSGACVIPAHLHRRRRHLPTAARPRPSSPATRPGAARRALPAGRQIIARRTPQWTEPQAEPWTPEWTRESTVRSRQS